MPQFDSQDSWLRNAWNSLSYWKTELVWIWHFNCNLEPPGMVIFRYKIKDISNHPGSYKDVMSLFGHVTF